MFKVLKPLSYYLNVTDPLIFLLIFSFLSCREKAHDNKEFSCENFLKIIDAINVVDVIYRMY